LVVAVTPNGDTLKARCGPTDAPQMIKARRVEIDATKSKKPSGAHSK